MQINSLLNPRYNNYRYSAQNKNICYAPKCSTSNSLNSFTTYPSNYYFSNLSFGKTNKEIYEQMEKASSNEEIMALFNELPDNVKEKCYSVVSKFENNGLTLDNYISACIKQPPLFCQSPKTIAQHIDILRFSKYNKSEEIDCEKFFDKILRHPVDLSSSTSLLLIKHLIIPKMFENDKIPTSLKKNHLKENLSNYLIDNLDKKYVINARNIESESDCIKLLKETLTKISTDALNRDDIFEVNVIE